MKLFNIVGSILFCLIMLLGLWGTGVIMLYVVPEWVLRWGVVVYFSVRLLDFLKIFLNSK